MVAEGSSEHCDVKVNAEKKYKWYKQTWKQITGGWVEVDVIFLDINLVMEKNLQKICCVNIYF